MSLALSAFALDPRALGGLWLFGRASPTRDAALEALKAALDLPQRRLHPGITDEALFGGLDLALTLQAGRGVRRPGILDQSAAMILPMAERCGPGLAARLAQALDGGRHALIALDESAAPDEALAPALADRMAIFVDLSQLAEVAIPDLTAARALRPRVILPEGAALEMARAAEALGVPQIRPLIASLAVARSLAALGGREVVSEDDLAQAAALSLAHRAKALPDPEPESQPEPQPETRRADTPSARDPDLSDILVAAARAALPPALLDQLAQGRARVASGGGAGQLKSGSRHGRPLAARPGRPANPAEMDLLASLRAAAPWQQHRRAGMAQAPALILRHSDLRLKRRQEHSDRLVIFAVDASGSSAVARLAEAKGAVELFLAEAYVKRDHVALLAFRGTGAELILPPTRSLARTKARLAGLPGGGGTPLAQALDLALATALAARRKGMTPTLALLTDGRGNIARDGKPGRAAAEADALSAARAIRAAGVAGLVLDVSNRPERGLAVLAATMGARYLALPRAQSHALAQSLSAALP